MSAQGRGPDSTLVHMTPREVEGLQKLAVANGTSLTINPDTGLPEAFSLQDLLPTLIGGAATYFTGGAITPLMAALGTGAVTALTSKDLGKGLMAGLGAYGGAGLVSGLAGFGAADIGEKAVSSAAADAAAAGLTNQSIMTDTTGVMSNPYATAMQKGVGDRMAGASYSDKFGAGLSKAMSDPMDAANAIGGGSKIAGLAKVAGALSPLLAGETGNTVQTVTPKQSTGKIRPFTYDPYYQEYTRGTPYTAANGGLVSFAEGGFNPTSPTQLANAIAASRRQGFSEADIQTGINKYGATQQQVDDSIKAAATPVNIAQGILGSQAQGFGASDINKGLGSYNFTEPQIQAGREYLSGSAAQSAVVSPTTDFKSTSIGNPQTGIAGLNQNITNYAGNVTPTTVKSLGLSDASSVEARIRSDMAKTGVNDKDVFNATGKTVAQLAAGAFPQPIQTSINTVVPGAGGSTSAGQVGGGTVVNPNGTITTSPVIPGIPVGGFTGVTQVRDSYTKGGGELGYTPTFVPKTIEEFNTEYKNTGYNKEMYDYLSGKGDMPTKMKNADGSFREVMRPYNEAVLQVPVNTNKPLTWDKVKGEYNRNPDYVRTAKSIIKDAEGKPKLNADGNYQYNTTTYKSINQAKAGIADKELTKTSGGALLDWAVTNNVDEQTVADALGIPMQEVIGMFAKAKADKKIPAKNGGLMQLANGGMAYDRGGEVKSDYIDSKGDTHVWDWENGMYRPEKLFKNNKSYTWDKVSNNYKLVGADAGLNSLVGMTGGSGVGGGYDSINPPNTTPITDNGFFASLLGRTTQPPAPVEDRIADAKTMEEIVDILNGLTVSGADISGGQFAGNTAYGGGSGRGSGGAQGAHSPAGGIASLSGGSLSAVENAIAQNISDVKMEAAAMKAANAAQFGTNQTMPASVLAAQNAIYAAGIAERQATQERAEQAQAAQKEAIDAAAFAGAQQAQEAQAQANREASTSTAPAPDAGPSSGADTGTAAGPAAGPDSDCVDPSTLILLANGTQTPAGKLKVGDFLHTLHEDTFVYGDFEVVHVKTVQQPKNIVTFTDGHNLTASDSHKFLMSNRTWKRVDALEAGDTVETAKGVNPNGFKTVAKIEAIGLGDVVKLSVDQAHTYISEGLVSHNKAMHGGGYIGSYAQGGLGSLGGYSDGGRLLRGPGDGVSDSIPATIGDRQPARLANNEFVIPARIVSEIGNGSTDAGAKRLYQMMDRIQNARKKSMGKGKIAVDSKAYLHLPA